MPNWCNNIVTIEGEEAEIDRLVEFMKSEHGEFDFNKLVPYPGEFRSADEIHNEIRKLTWRRPKGRPLSDEEEHKLQELQKAAPEKDGFNSGGYEWRYENWGTKWPARVTQVDRAFPHKVEYTFDTAWSPPEPVILELAIKFPDVNITLDYAECGMECCGIKEYRSAADIDDDELDWIAEEILGATESGEEYDGEEFKKAKEEARRKVREYPDMYRLVRNMSGDYHGSRGG